MISVTTVGYAGKPAFGFPLTNLRRETEFKKKVLLYHIVEASPEFGGEYRVVLGRVVGINKPPTYTLLFRSENRAQQIDYGFLDRWGDSRAPDGFLEVDAFGGKRKLRFYVIDLDL